MADTLLSRLRSQAEMHQRVMRDAEDTIRRSREVLARSRKLLEQTIWQQKPRLVRDPSGG
jgi:hypothetical protein